MQGRSSYSPIPYYHNGVKSVVWDSRIFFSWKPVDSQQPTQPLVDQLVKPISALVDPTLLSKSDPDVIEPMSSLVNTTLCPTLP